MYEHYDQLFIIWKRLDDYKKWIKQLVNFVLPKTESLIKGKVNALMTEQIKWFYITFWIDCIHMKSSTSLSTIICTQFLLQNVFTFPSSSAFKFFPPLS